MTRASSSQLRPLQLAPQQQLPSSVASSSSSVATYSHSTRNRYQRPTGDDAVETTSKFWKASEGSIVGLHRKILQLVTKKYGQIWTLKQVKANIHYAQDKYKKAKDMAKQTGQYTDEDGTSRKKMLQECPFYDRLDAVYMSNAVINADPPIDTFSLPREEQPEYESEVEASAFDDEQFDSDESDNAIDSVSVESSSTPRKAKSSMPPSAKSRKRKQGESIASIREHLAGIRGASSKVADSQKSWTDQLLQQTIVQEDLLSRRRKDFEAEMAERKAALRQARQEWEDERLRLRKGMEEDHARLRKELEEERERSRKGLEEEKERSRKELEEERERSRKVLEEERERSRKRLEEEKERLRKELEEVRTKYEILLCELAAAKKELELRTGNSIGTITT
ncbi:hypothetical protein BC939DRAFT_496824 [Gamsiella multidivaricata]|uniref:uncharacterized protein n=1 Tax=Gamsiella multidivaricata TaxID=101098 RepID=UPI00221F1079|nr:uncharacterized protein BC939DRAFT_496824 [Gamsiella multidivaricata]KAI7817221.1 hypothetical protein BC939DRAFT_496824 [Gamsiella multidivaricata]